MAKKKDSNYYMTEGIAQSGIAPVSNPAFLNSDYEPFKTGVISRNIGQYFDSDSSYDEVLGGVEDAIESGLNVGDLRANAQSGWDMVGNALTNNIVIAGTTAISSSIGLVDGIFEALGSGDVSKLWDNTVTNAMVNTQDYMKEALPIYRGSQYENLSIWNKLGTGIFWADLVENLGFTEGMIIPGLGVSRIMQAAPKAVKMLVPSMVSAMGEGAQEAINYRNEEVRDKTNTAISEYNRLAENAVTPGDRERLKHNFDREIESIESDATNGGNFVFGSNIALLTLTNTIEFGNLFSRGFGTAKRLKGAISRQGNKYISDSPVWYATKAAGKKLVDATSEGLEEVSQAVISNTPINFSDYNHFNESIFNPEKRQLAADLISAIGQSYAEKMNDPRTAEEFASGFIIGALGVPTLRKGVVPIKLENNAFYEIYGAYKEGKRQEDLANRINERLKDSKSFNAYYNGLVRHLVLDSEKEQLLDLDDNKLYKDAESALFHSDIKMFDDAGDISRLKELINNSIDLSDEGIDELISSTSKDGEGPFIQNGNPSTKEDIRYIINSKIEELNNKIDNYVADKRRLEESYPNMDQATLDNALFLKEQYRDTQYRLNKLTDSVTGKLNGILIDNKKRILEELRKAGETNSKDLEDLEKKAAPNISPMQLVFYGKDKAFTDNINGLIELSELTADEQESLLKGLKDIPRLADSKVAINKSLADILNNPSKSQEELNETKDKAVKSKENKEVNDLKDSLSKASTLGEFRNLINNNDSSEQKGRVLKELEDEGNTMAKNYRETSQYNSEVMRVINESDAEPQVKQDALKLLQDQLDNSEDLEQLANPNSIYINNENAFDEDSGGDVELSATRFREAQYRLQKAMSKVNNDNRFKDRFSPEYKKPIEKMEGTTRGDDRASTGDSQTSTIPAINISTLPVTSITETPIGNITQEMVIEENKRTNERVETPQRPSRDTFSRFYRPAIPELHIEASKEGDFRPFDVVASEREKGVDFSEIYSYLRDHGAFRYINEGNLKAGDELGFMIDPNFNDHTIFIIDKRNGQVVGSLDESDYSISRYEGLKGLEERIRKEFAERATSQESKDDLILITNTHNGYNRLGTLKDWSRATADIRTKPDGFGTENGLHYFKQSHKGGRGGDNITIWFKTEPSQRVKDSIEQLLNDSSNLNEFGDKLANLIRSTQSKGKFVATPTTKVSKIMVGRVPYGNTEKSLRDIPNVSGGSRAPIFGIIKNGVLTTNGKVDDSLIIKPVDMAQKEGRLYLLIPNGAGKYSPTAVRVKHFNNEEFNLDDVTISNTPMGKDISAAITKLANASSQDDVSQAMQNLAQDLYMQDVMVTWFDGRAGSGIVISKKVRKPDGTYEKITINGKEQIKEDKYDVYFSTSKKSVEIKGINFDVTALEDLGDTSALGTPKDPNDIYKEILGHLTKFNLPLQVSTGLINNGAYNNRLINSGILTSNITNASVIGNWFTTDYFDNEGNLHQAISPTSITPKPNGKVETPVGGTEGAIAGTKITSVFSNKTYYVDLKTNTIRDDQGKNVEITSNNRILFDLAWAQDNFGDATVSSVMIDNKIITPSGQVLDRTTQKYITGQEAQDVKDTIAGKKRESEDKIAKSNEVVKEIHSNQSKVDKTRTDGEFYYILEDDGQYHEYSRVHSRLGSNWIESTKQTEALEQIKANLSKFVDTPTQYNNYLKFLENKYKKYELNLESYQSKTDAKSRDAIVNIVRDAMSNIKSQRALGAGTSVDSIVRQYFTVKDVSKIVKPDNMTERAFIDLITELNRIKSNMEHMGERFLADNIVLFQKYPDGTRVAGEVDILAVDKYGNFKIYDIKTSGYSFYGFTDRRGNKINYFTTPSPTQRMSSKDYYTLQLSAYKNLFESQYGVPVTKLAVMPFVLNYEKENVSGVQSEKGIPITYNPAVNVPLVGNVKVDKPVEAPATPAQEPPLLPIYDSSLELQNPIEDLAPEYSMNTGDDESVGYFEIDGKLHKGYMTRLTVVDGIPVMITKVPNITSGFGRQGETAHVASNSYYAVFPNGKTFLALKNNPVQGGYSQSQVEQAVSKMLEGNPQKVKDMSNEKTILFDPNAVPTVNTAPITTVETPATINQSTTQTGAAYTAQKEQAVMEHDDEFEDEFTLRRVDETVEAPVWNQEKELNWLSRVLPQLSESDRVKVVKGLIKVDRQGALAWGQFDNGVITLSDIAAEGTIYHEAFHAVFNLLLDQSERQALYDEARRIYGEKDNLSLEEDMAEGFREYVMTRQNRGLGRRILDFFKELFTKVTNWNNFRPSLISYYQRINEGKYADSNFKVPTISELRGATPNTTTFNSLSESIRENLTRKGWTEEKFNSISQDERDHALRCIAF